MQRSADPGWPARCTRQVRHLATPAEENLLVGVLLGAGDVVRLENLNVVAEARVRVDVKALSAAHVPDADHLRHSRCVRLVCRQCRGSGNSGDQGCDQRFQWHIVTPVTSKKSMHFSLSQRPDGKLVRNLPGRRLVQNVLPQPDANCSACRVIPSGMAIVKNYQNR